MSKLTLHVDDQLITLAKEEAASRGTSVSKLVSDFFRVLASKPPHPHETHLPPVTSSLLGCLEGADSDTENYIDYLEEKHS